MGTGYRRSLRQHGPVVLAEDHENATVQRKLVRKGVLEITLGPPELGLFKLENHTERASKNVGREWKIRHLVISHHVARGGSWGLQV